MKTTDTMPPLPFPSNSPKPKGFMCFDDELEPCCCFSSCFM